MLGGDALVAEILAELVDALEAADDEALEIQLGGDPQVEVAIQRVVVRDEGARSSTTVERLKHRRLDLNEVRVIERAPNARDHLGARHEAIARLGVGHQIEVALAMPNFNVLQSMVTVGEWQAARRELDPLGDLDAQFASACSCRDADNANQVADRDRANLLERLLTELLKVGQQLDTTRHVLEVDKRHAALATTAKHAPSNAPRLRACLFGLESVLGRA